ncbi:hypothetical protein J6590_013232 [Homalodisca vitripennis]|nr:hypothetical protein J6590_013232 [Homalodisca vitripennis]
MTTRYARISHSEERITARASVHKRASHKSGLLQGARERTALTLRVTPGSQRPIVRPVAKVPLFQECLLLSTLSCQQT